MEDHAMSPYNHFWTHWICKLPQDRGVTTEISIMIMLKREMKIEEYNHNNQNDN